MQRKRGELVPIGDAVSGLDDVPVPAIPAASPQAVHHFTQADQVNLLVSAREADPDLGFMARTMALCSLPRSNPGNRLQYKRVNGPFTLIMYSSGETKLPFGNFPRLILAWVSTEAVRTQNRVLILGSSLAKFMRELGVYSSGGGNVHTKLRNQMKRLFGCTVQLTYKEEHGEATVNTVIADRTEFWWNERKPAQSSLWDSKIELSEKFFNEIISHPVPLDMNTLTALKRSSLGLDLYLWLVLPDLPAPRSATDHLEAGVPPVRIGPGQGQRQRNRSKLPPGGSARVEEDQASLAGLELHDGSGCPDPLTIDTSHRSGRAAFAPGVAPQAPFPGARIARHGLGGPDQTLI